MAEKKRDTSKKRESILDAAVQAFEELGYEKASMDYVAEVAQASKRTVYNHFESKEVLFEAVMDRFLEEVFQLKQIPYRSNVSLREQLNEFAQTKLLLASEPELLGLMRVAFGVFISHPQMAQRIYEKADSHEDSLSIWLEAANKDGRLNVDDPDVAANVFWSMFSGAFFWPAILQGPVEVDCGEKLKKAFLDTFLARYGN